jgi:very-short-patch-repair endonuclease
LAARQHGVVALAQLIALGLNREWVRRRVAAGRLHRVHRGVYAVGHPALSREGRWMAAVLAAGEASALSHLSVAQFWRVSRWPERTISVVSTARRTLDGVEVHTARSLDPRDLLVWKGIPVTTVARMCVDLTDVLTPHQLAFVIYRAEYWGIFDLAATEACRARAQGRRNLRVLDRALELRAQGSAGTRSAKEDAFLERQDVEPLVNTRIEVDFQWPDKRRVVEIDGPHHRLRATKLEDQRRDGRLAAEGWDVERIDVA